MRAKIIKIQEQKSYLGGNYFYIFFKSDEGRSFRTCAYQGFGNFKRWLPFIEKHRQGKEVWLDGLNTCGKCLIDCDSFPREILNETAAA